MVEVLDVATGTPVGRAPVATTYVASFALAPDGRTLAVYDPLTVNVHLFDIPSGTP